MNSNNALLVIATLIIAAGAYWYFFTGTGNQPPLVADITGSGTQAQFKTLVSELQPISFDTGIFSDPRFMALVDLTTPVAPEAPGRLDPFAPISGASGK